MNNELKLRINMIIYNIYAFLVFVFALVVTYFLSFLDINIDNLGNPYFWIIVLSISGIADIFKIRTRLYFFPLWLVSLIIAIILSLNIYEGNDLYIALSFILFILFSGSYIMKLMANKGWKTAQESMRSLNANQSESKYEELLKAFYVPEYMYPNSGFQYILLGKIYRPIYLKWISKKEVNKHFIDICNHLKSLVTKSEYNRYVSLFEARLIKVQNNEKTYFDQHMFEYIIELIKKYKK